LIYNVNEIKDTFSTWVVVEYVGIINVVSLHSIIRAKVAEMKFMLGRLRKKMLKKNIDR
jgi:hypothetical protein